MIFLPQDGNGKLDYDEFVKMMLQYWNQSFISTFSMTGIFFLDENNYISQYLTPVTDGADTWGGVKSKKSSFFYTCVE